MPDPIANPHKRDPIAPGFGRRLAYYVLGIAIGLMLLGFFQQMKSGAVQRQMAQPGASSGAAEDAADSPEPATHTPDEQPAAADD